MIANLQQKRRVAALAGMYTVSEENLQVGYSLLIIARVVIALCMRLTSSLLTYTKREWIWLMNKRRNYRLQYCVMPGGFSHIQLDKYCVGTCVAGHVQTLYRYMKSPLDRSH